MSLVASEGTAADTKFLPELVKNASRNFNIEEVSADKAYPSKKNFEEIAKVGAVSFIPFKSNHKANKNGSLWKTYYEFYYDNKEEFNKHYHQRSNVETAFGMIKKNYRNNLRTKSADSQINELYIKCLCHNLSVLIQESFELKIEINFKKCCENYVAQADSL